MIQRLQTVFLLFIFILSVLTFFMPVIAITLFQNQIPVYITTLDSWFMYVPMILNCIVTLLSIGCIFLFKNRKLQIKLCTYIIIDSVIIALSFIYIIVMAGKDNLAITYKITVLFPVLNTLLALLARKFIKKDEDLVRSADRIR